MPDLEEDDDMIDDMDLFTDLPTDNFIAEIPDFQPSQIRLEDLRKDEPPAISTFYTDHDFTPDIPEDDTEVELYLSREMAHWSTLCERELEPDEHMVLVVNQSKVAAVIRREFDALTKDESKEHQEQVDAAMMDELKRWHGLNTFRRKLRKESSNVLDGTWAIRWKSVKGTNSKGEVIFQRIIKARLTARGFKDLQAYNENIDTYSGTSTKASQRMVNGFAAQHQYTLFSMDISAAFLKGLTFEEISRLTGKPLRSVQFVVPANCVHLLRKLPGMEDFDHVLEVLDFLKAMWGLKDAPRAFGLRRDMTLTRYGARPTIRDPHLWIKTFAGPKGTIAVAMLSTHLDDVKGGATEVERKELQGLLEEDFGDDLKSSTGTFEFTGVKHLQDANNKEIFAHQDHYVAELSVIPLDGVDDDSEELAQYDEACAFVSLLGGLSWLLITRADISAFVGYLQRLAGKPLRRHLKMINAVLKFVKRRGSGIRYIRLVGKPYIQSFSAFTRGWRGKWRRAGRKGVGNTIISISIPSPAIIIISQIIIRPVAVFSQI